MALGFNGNNMAVKIIKKGDNPVSKNPVKKK
jgi:hypothetical protein